MLVPSASLSFIYHPPSNSGSFVCFEVHSATIRPHMGSSLVFGKRCDSLEVETILGAILLATQNYLLFSTRSLGFHDDPIWRRRHIFQMGWFNHQLRGVRIPFSEKQRHHLTCLQCFWIRHDFSKTEMVSRLQSRPLYALSTLLQKKRSSTGEKRSFPKAHLLRLGFPKRTHQAMSQLHVEVGASVPPWCLCYDPEMIQKTKC